MPITAYSNEAAREVDLEQWLALNGYSTQDDPLLARMPLELRDKAALDIECSGCRARGATLVRVARAKGKGRAVNQGHFRFGTASGANPHDPLCDFYNESLGRGGEYLANFGNDKSVLTRTIRDLVCRGIQASLFSQSDMRQMRLWFLQERGEHAITLDVTPELIQWCVDMCGMKIWSPDQVPFRPEHGQLPGFDWDRAAAREWVRRNTPLYDAIEWRVRFRQDTIKRPLQLIDQYAGMTVLDPTALRDKYVAVVQLAGFAARYVFCLAGVKEPKAFHRHVSDWGVQGHVLLALAALLLFKNDWDVARASTMFSVLTTLQPTAKGLEGNIIGINPFYDYPAWQVINAARQIAALRTDSRPVGDQIASLKAELQASHLDWAVQALSDGA